MVTTAVLAGCHYDEFVVSAAPATFTIRELGLLPGGTQSQANAASTSAATIVGWATAAGVARHAVWFAGGQAHALQEPAGATSSEALGANDNGTIVGFAVIAGDTNAVSWPAAAAAPVLLPNLGGTYSLAAAISQQGEIVGQAEAVDTVVLVKWLPSGASYTVERLRVERITVTNMGADTAIDTITVGQDYDAVAINNLGQVVGNLPVSDSETSGFIWGEALTLDTIEAPSGAATDANSLNDYGVVVGSFATPSGPSRGFLYTGALGSFVLGGAPSGYTDVEANAVNDSGRVAGYAFTADNAGNPLTSVPLIGTMIDSVQNFTPLPTLGGSLAQPVDHAITSCGVVLGWATKSASPTIRYAVAWVPQGCALP